MSRDWMTEILSAQADALNGRVAGRNESAASLAPEARAELKALEQTAARAKRALVPVAIPPEFRARLQDGLTLAARHQESQNIMLGRSDPAWGWVIGAAALGSAAGLIAIAWRARHSPRAVRDITPSQ